MNDKQLLKVLCDVDTNHPQGRKAYNSPVARDTHRPSPAQQNSK